MALSAFDDKSTKPTAAKLRATLGPAAALWDALVDDVATITGSRVTEWAFAGAKFGWSMRLKDGARNIVHMTPQSGRFLVGVALGEKPVAAAKAAGTVPADVLAIVAAAPKYAEGRGVRIEVADRAGLARAEHLVRIKTGRVPEASP